MYILFFDYSDILKFNIFIKYLQEHFIEKNTEFISESVLKLGETSLRKITDSIVSLVKPNKRFVSEGVKLKQQLKMLLRTLDENVEYLYNELNF